MTEYAIIIETYREEPDAQQTKIYHRIDMTKRNNLAWRSIEAFKYGKRSDSTASDSYKNRCCIAPNRRYLVKFNEEEWLEEEKDAYASYLTMPNVRLNARQNPDNYVYVDHDSIFAFYRHINFDRKRRRYLKEGEFFLEDYA